MAITLKVIEKLDELVERADYGGPNDDVLLASAISDYWTEIEPILRSAADDPVVRNPRRSKGAHSR
jgi:hypothetical protein